MPENDHWKRNVSSSRRWHDKSECVDRTSSGGLLKIRGATAENTLPLTVDSLTVGTIRWSLPATLSMLVDQEHQRCRRWNSSGKREGERGGRGREREGRRMSLGVLPDMLSLIHI